MICCRTQYRSAIFVHSKKQLHKVQFYIGTLTKEQVYQEPIVMEVVPASIILPRRRLSSRLL
ncbi:MULTISPECIES: peptide-methionine (S)-S-oxide reductase [Sphingobacterium]|uniref:peptide-methionine (S)-S-oxide reductase n=1 Tax=Sphingobacterium TaxID=28453 RepID=UPI001FEC3171|nr:MULTISPECIES: peptide-methionine (S)-S-oxide reductase [Sphingobacterium]